LSDILYISAESSLEEVGLSVRSEDPRQPEQEVSLFTAVSRPNSVQKLYSQAKVTPRAVYAALGPSGWKSAKNFCLTPVLKEPGETTYKLVKRQVREYSVTPSTDIQLCCGLKLEKSYFKRLRCWYENKQ